MPGSLMFWLETEIASEATTKNQPPDMDIIMFHSSPGSGEGQLQPPEPLPGERWNMLAASLSSSGTVQQ